VNHGPRGDCLMKKIEGRKSRDTVPLNINFGKQNKTNLEWH
jgi:hypothetical protein